MGPLYSALNNRVRMLLVAHITLGAILVGLGVTALSLRKVRGYHTLVGEVYHWMMLAVCLTAAVLAFLDWDRLWWSLLLALWSYGFALGGYLAAKRRKKNWILRHAFCQSVSIVAVMTAVTVTNWDVLTFYAALPSVLGWILPAALGYGGVAWVTLQVARGKRPRLNA